MASKLELSGKCDHKFVERVGRINNAYREVVYKCIYCRKVMTKFYSLEKLESGEITCPTVLPR